MAFGPIMKFTTKTGLVIEMAPFTREEAVIFVDGFAKHSVNRYVSTMVQTKETEEEWYDKSIKDRSSCYWGIWAIENGKRTLIGNSSLSHITSDKIIRQAVSGIILTNTDYWGKGIASASHKARTYFAFEQLGLHRIKSAVLQANKASRAALERSGYVFVYTERNDAFIDGRQVHLDCLECLNPADWAWRQWWGDDRPSRKHIDGRKYTAAAIDWARQHVELM